MKLKTRHFRLLFKNIRLISIFAAIAYWFADSWVHFYYFDNQSFPLEIIPKDINEFGMRLIICTLIILLGFIPPYIKQKAVSQEKEKNDGFYQNLLNTTTEAFFLHDKEGKLLDTNIQACDSLGYSRNELLNMSVSDIEVGPDPEALNQLWDNLEKGENVYVEGIHRRKDGSTFPVEASLGLVKIDDEFLFSVLARDISERKKNEAIIKSAEQRMALHRLRTPIGVIEWDINFCVIDWNPAAEDIFGFSTNEALGCHARDLIIPPQVVKHVDAVWKNLLTLENGLRSTNENITKDGKTIMCDWYNTPILDETGNVLSIVSLVKDITKETNAEQALIKAKEDAEDANKAKSIFLSHMSHEIRTPMNAVLGFSQLLSFDDDLSNQQKDTVQEIIVAGNHLMKIIDEILELTAIESETFELKLDNYKLNNILHECIASSQSLADARKINIINNISPNSDYKINIDYLYFKRILLNLLSNAIKYNNEYGTVTIDSVAIDNKYICLYVRDTGNGLTEQEQQNLFKKFEQAGKYKGIDGVGIGLVTSKELIEKMGGEIGFESEEGKGSSFWLQIKLTE